MIQANESRVGNWVIRNGETLQLSNFLLMAEAAGSKDISPIPLTPEILVKCGFTQNTWKQYEIELNGLSAVKKVLYFSGDYLYLEEGERQRTKDLVTIWNTDIMKTFYLHQLQNLYFALTGKELNYQP